MKFIRYDGRLYAQEDRTTYEVRSISPAEQPLLPLVVIALAVGFLATYLVF